ncbi:MAG: flippase [Thermodesulfobacteriota bacterium]
MIEEGSSIRRKVFIFYHEAVSSDFVHKVGETFATKILLIGIGLVTTVIVARILGPDGRGLYAVAAAIGAIGVQFGNLGLHASNTYYVSKDRNLLPILVGNTLMISFVFGGLGAAMGWAIFTLFPHLVPVHRLLLVLALAWVPFGLAYMLLQNLLLGIQEVRAYNKIELITRILGVGLIGLAILFGAVTVETIFTMVLLAMIVSFVWALWRIREHLEGRPLPSLSLFKDNISYGFKAYLAALFSFLVLRVDMLMVQYLLDSEQTGYYSIAVAMADLVFMLPVAIGTILFPKLSAMSDMQVKWKSTKKVITVVGGIMVVSAVIVGFIAEPVVRMLFGKAFIPAVPAFIWLMPGIVMLSVNVVYMIYFASIGMPWITVYSPCMALLLNVLINLELIPLFGIVGASISSLFSYGLMLVISIVFNYAQGKGLYEQ